MADVASAPQVAPARRRGQLTRAAILAAALRVVDEDGLEALTMRRLARALRVDPMSIYNHVDGKEALLEGVAEALWLEVHLPLDAQSWPETLRGFAVSLRQAGHDHPRAYRLLLGLGILPAPALQVIDTALAALEAAGVSRERAAEMVRTLVAYAVGYAMLEISAAPAACSGSLEQIVRLTRALPPGTPVHLIDVARLMCVDCDMDHQFQLGLDLILAGFAARL